MYVRHMKLTLNIDDELLGRVMESTGAKTKTDAIHAALAEVDRRHKLIALLSDDFGMTPQDWKNAIDENSWHEEETARIAETPSTGTAKSTATIKRAPVRYGRKPRPRR